MGRNIYYVILAVSVASSWVMLTLIAIDKGWFQ